VQSYDGVAGWCAAVMSAWCVMSAVLSSSRRGVLLAGLQGLAPAVTGPAARVGRGNPPQPATSLPPAYEASTRYSRWCVPVPTIVASDPQMHRSRAPRKGLGLGTRRWLVLVLFCRFRPLHVCLRPLSPGRIHAECTPRPACSDTPPVYLCRAALSCAALLCLPCPACPVLPCRLPLLSRKSQIQI
jgi:hypothetical protein